MSTLGEQIAAKARAAAAKVAEMNGLAPRPTTLHGFIVGAGQQQAMLALGAGDGFKDPQQFDPSSGALIPHDPAQHVNKMMPGAHFNQRVNGALVVGPPARYPPPVIDRRSNP
jgi:hypothetical protein